MRESEPGGVGVMKITGKLDIYHASEWREVMLKELESEEALKVDLSAVEACDAIGLQLLWSARKAAGQAGKGFEVTGVGETVSAACAGLGLDAGELAAAWGEGL